ncbi:MAG: hypothetical protein LBP28_02845, partial [Coriobacteriales bacterium]|nr:hypothetical protein [Coriobacteriales bacterium]
MSAPRNTEQKVACGEGRGSRDLHAVRDNSRRAPEGQGRGIMRQLLRAALAALLVLSLVPTMSVAIDLAPMAAAAPAAVPQFSRHPADATYSEEAPTRFYVRADSTDGGYLSYQWYRSQAYPDPVADAATSTTVQDAIKKTGTALPASAGGTSSVLRDTTPAVDATTYYYYWVTVTN